MITTSLELSKRLKEVGYPQPKERDGPFWFWYEDRLWLLSGQETDSGCYGPSWERDGIDCWEFESRPAGEWYVAPTAEEILEKLPKEIEKDRTKYVLQIFWYTHEDGGPCVRYVSDMGTDYWDEYPEYGVVGDTLTESLGLMYLHLKEHNLLPLA